MKERKFHYDCCSCIVQLLFLLSLFILFRVNVDVESGKRDMKLVKAMLIFVSFSYIKTAAL